MSVLYVNGFITLEELKEKAEKLQADKKVLQAKINSANHVASAPYNGATLR